MSEMAQAARAASREKARRLVGGMHGGAGPGTDPAKKIDASGWSEPTDMNTTAPTGMRPVSRRQFRQGGKVEGERVHARADRKGRKSGGKVDDYINRDVRAANHQIAQPHIGGFAAGGGTNFRKQMHADIAEDKRLIKHMVKPAALRSKKRNGGGQWIQSAIKHPGALHKELHVPKGEKIPAKKLEKAAHSDNPKLAKRAHLAETLERMHKASGGSLDYKDINGMRPKGDRIPRKHGGKAKGKTNIIIGIHAGQPQQQPPMAAPMMPPRPSVGAPPPPPMPPQGMPPGMGSGMPPMAGALPMPRKSGGKVVGATYGDASIAKAERVKSVKDIPAGGGLGRLAKRSIAQKDGFRAE